MANPSGHMNEGGRHTGNSSSLEPTSKSLHPRLALQNLGAHSQNMSRLYKTRVSCHVAKSSGSRLVIAAEKALRPAMEKALPGRSAQGQQ